MEHTVAVLFTGVRGRGILRTSHCWRSPNFAGKEFCELRLNGVLRSPDARSCIASVQRALRHVFVWPRLDRPDAAAHPRAWKGSPLRKCLEGTGALRKGIAAHLVAGCEWPLCESGTYEQ